MANPVAAPPAKLDMPVEVTGVDAFGQSFIESTRTISIQRDGISILLPCLLAPNSEVIVRNPGTGEEAIASVAAHKPGEPAGEVYELAFLNPEADLWNTFSRPAAVAKTLHLECTGCHSVSTFSLSDSDMETFESTRELIRLCSTCNASGIWREVSREARTQKPNDSSAQPESSGSTPGGAPKEDRRKNRRTAIKMAACIRFSGVDLVVDCEDVSKGGFRFKCRSQYPQGTRLEASVPYHTKSSTNIFTPAAVSYCLKMPDGQFRHGVTYVKNGGTVGWNS